MKARRKTVGGFTPQPKNQINKSNTRLKLWDLCEFPHTDRKNSPSKTELVNTGSVFVVKEEVL